MFLRNVAILTLKKSENVEAAIAKMNGYIIEGIKLKVKKYNVSKRIKSIENGMINGNKSWSQGAVSSYSMCRDNWRSNWQGHHFHGSDNSQKILHQQEYTGFEALLTEFLDFVAFCIVWLFERGPGPKQCVCCSCKQSQETTKWRLNGRDVRKVKFYNYLSVAQVSKAPIHTAANCCANC